MLLYVVVYFSDMFHLIQYRNTYADIGTQQLGLTSHINSGINSNLNREDMDLYYKS